MSARGDRMLQSLANRLMSLDRAIDTQRNVQFTEAETIEYINKMKNANTVAKTRSDVKRAKEWLISVGENREMFDIPPHELNVLLARMFLAVKCSNGNEYEPESLKSLQSSINRHLADNNYGHSLTKSDAFKHSRDVLFSKKKGLKQEGRGNKKHRADPFTDEEINTLRDKSLLGDENPEALINAIWLNNTIHFGLRSRQEHLTMLWGDIELKTTSDGTEYVVFTERATKTRNGADSDPRQFQPKMFAQPGDPYCPVKLYKSYSSKRPEKMNVPDAKFYLSKNPNYGKGMNSSRWFMNAPMGKNTLGQIAKRMSESAGLSGNHTNHCRKTCITQLLDAHVPAIEVVQLSGHKNLMSLNHYNSVNLNKQMHMSTVLHRVAADGDKEAGVSRPAEMFDNDEVSDEEMLAVSQDIEDTLKTIDRFENEKNAPVGQIVDLSITQNPDGSLKMNEKRIHPENLFTNCTFNAVVHFTFK